MALGAKAEGEEERSLRDDLAAGLKEIEEREALTAPEGVEAPDPEAEANAQAPEAQADRGDGRDAHGRFITKPKEGEEAAPAAGSTEPAAPATTDQPGSQTPAAQPETDTAPKSWRADEAQSWKDLPAPAKAAILRRETEAARLAGANDEERMFGRQMADVFRPHLHEIQAAGATPQNALTTLLGNHNALRSNDPAVKLNTARRLLMEYGIDPAQVAQSDPNAPPLYVVQLQNEVAQLRSRLGQPQAQNFAPLPPSQEEHNILSEIEAFREDPAHPHFDAVQATMAKLLETEQAPDLQSAYDAAVAINPALRSTAQPAPQRPKQEDKTAAARRASASVSGSPGTSGNPAPMTLRDELAEGLRSAGFSV